MAAPEDPVELELVRKAISRCRRGGYCEWNGKAALRVREELAPVTPEYIKSLLYEHVVRRNGKVLQVQEKRDFNYRYYYKAVIAAPGFRKGLFVELRLIDNDPEEPAVEIVNAHEQR